MTGRTDIDHSLAAAEMETLKNAIWPVKEILELEGRFQEKDAMRVASQRVNSRLWTVNGGWRVVDTVCPNPSDRTINVYRWNEQAKEVLQDYVNNQNTLPCGHRAHVYNLPNKEGFSCRFCDDWPQYDRETVENCL